MKLVVTGATGFIGKRLIWRLLRDGHDVVVLSRDARSAVAKIGYPCESHSWDPASEAAPSAAFEGADAVIHLAGEPIAAGRWTKARKKRIEESRVVGTRNLVEGIRRAARKPAALVSTSAIGIYGDRGDELLDEASAHGADFLAKVCIGWEKEALAAPKEVRTALVRVGIVLDHDEGALPRMVLPVESGVGGPLGSGRQWMSWIHVDDLVSILIEAATRKDLSGPVNAVAPEPVTNANFVRALASHLGMPAVLRAPAFALKLALGEMASVVLSGQRVRPAALEKSGFRFAYPTLQAALGQIFPPHRPRGAHRMVSNQWVPRPVGEVFPFFSDEKNLEAITPPWLNFNVKGKNTPEIRKGTLIDYRLKLKGLPMGWRTLIAEWEPDRMFRDVQLKGPYSVWDHTHTFEPFRGGTLIRDEVWYRLPFAPFGNVALPMVRKDVSAIFGFREKKIREVFP